MVLITGNGTNSDWDEAMMLEFDERASAEEDLTDVTQLTNASSETLARAYVMFVGGFQREWEAHSAMRPDEPMECTRNGVWAMWADRAEQHGVGVFCSGSAHAVRREAYERDAHGVGIRGSATQPGDMISRTAPLPTQGAVTGNLYVARAGATNADMQAILTTVAAAKESDWAKAVTDMCSFETPKGKALEIVLNAVAPGLTAEQRMARVDQSGVIDGALVGALCGSTEERSKRMGWASDIISGAELRKAVEGRVRRIVAEEQHVGAGRSSEERSPARAKRRTDGAAAPSVHGARAANAAARTSATGREEPVRGRRGGADAAAGPDGGMAMAMDEFDDDFDGGGAHGDCGGDYDGGGYDAGVELEPPWGRRQRPPPQHGYGDDRRGARRKSDDDDERLTRTIAAVMDGQQAQ